MNDVGELLKRHGLGSEDIDWSQRALKGSGGATARVVLRTVARCLDIGWESAAHTGLTASELQRVADARALLAEVLR